MKDLCVSGIWIYPIKSMGGIFLKEAKIMPKGLLYDRRWMLVGDDGVFLSQRTMPKMALFKQEIIEDRLVVSFGADQINIPLSYEMNTNQTLVKIWDDVVNVLEVGVWYDRWFGERLGVNCKLVYFPEENLRRIDPKYVSEESHVALSDGYPILLIGQASLDDLNAKLNEPVPMDRFRPNIVFSGGNAFDEDKWVNFYVNDHGFGVVKPCARCVTTTIDQATGIKGDEPLNTLASYRRREQKVYFGQNIIAKSIGVISVGDKIKIETFKG